MSDQNAFLTIALNTWKTNIERADKLFSSFSDAQLLKDVAPGKNRLLYVFGHLTAVHDRMLPLLGFGQQSYPDLDAAFIAIPDKSQANIPSVQQVKQAWKDVNQKLSEEFARLSPADWLQKHTAVSEEDFAKDPSRNRFAVLMSRTNHLSYHLGQAILAPK
jgi:hypothetical protein